MVVKALVLIASVLLVGACSDSGGGSSSSGQETALEGITPARMCELLPNDSLEEALGVTVAEAKGREAGVPPILNKYCTYSVEFALEELETLPPQITTAVGQTRDKGVDELLDESFTDLLNDDEQVGDYERVEGLGEGAGYGNDPLDGGTKDAALLVVVFTAGDERFEFEIGATPRTPLDQLRPLADDLLASLTAELS